MQLECELIELEFVNGLGDLSLLSLLGSLSFFFPDSLVFSLLNSLSSLSGFFVSSLFGLSGFFPGSLCSLSGFFVGSLCSFSGFFVGSLSGFLDGRGGSRSASVASFTLVVEEVLNAFGLDLESHFGSEVREIGSFDVLRL